MKSVTGLLYRFRITGAGGAGSACGTATGAGAVGETWTTGMPAGIVISFRRARMALRTAKEKTRAVNRKRLMAKRIVIPAIITIRLSCWTAHPPMTKSTQ